MSIRAPAARVTDIAAVLIGDIWQWTPFMFIVLLAALESISVEQIEAALVDGANRWQIFWHISVPAILPVSTTLILTRMIEAFKIVAGVNAATFDIANQNLREAFDQHPAQCVYFTTEAGLAQIAAARSSSG